MKELSNKNKSYEAPQLTVVTFKVEQGFAESTFSSLVGAFRLNNSWSDVGGNAWDGSGTSEGGNRFGSGWVDNGGSAWE